ncbi:hypothetical protein AWB78_08098 [Caballeronia calidae]|uniref:Uncharacterized protein n=1 Tax=Caballeronia calidae TaxID=1777139 RepID=A0A158EI37_9BURK|nr:hypothetical protein AWB78_08098 [Caballeronia calidae]
MFAGANAPGFAEQARYPKARRKFGPALKLLAMLRAPARMRRREEIFMIVGLVKISIAVEGTRDPVDGLRACLFVAPAKACFVDGIVRRPPQALSKHSILPQLVRLLLGTSLPAIGPRQQSHGLIAVFGPPTICSIHDVRSGYAFKISSIYPSIRLKFRRLKRPTRWRHFVQPRWFVKDQEVIP